MRSRQAILALGLCGLIGGTSAGCIYSDKKEKVAAEPAVVQKETRVVEAPRREPDTVIIHDHRWP